MRRTYSSIHKRVTVNLDQNGDQRLEEVYARLQRRYKLIDKPSMSLMLTVALKRLVDEDESRVDKLWNELQEEAATKQPREDDPKAITGAYKQMRSAGYAHSPSSHIKKVQG